MTGSSVEQYDAPLFIAWQLTNHCNARCAACCEESGPDETWGDELTRDEALRVARLIVEAEVPFAAFGGGEPLGVAHCWDIFEVLAGGGVALKLETDGRHIDADTADRLAALAVECVQISVDGATASTHERVRPGSSFVAAIAAIERLVERGHPPQFVFVPNRINLHETLAAYDLARQLGCESFVTGPMMRLGRAAVNWDRLACSDEEWERAAQALREHSRSPGPPIRLSIYPWDIVTEMERRLESPQAMLLIVPNGRVKLLNALPFAVADLRHDSIAQAWQAYREAWRAPEVHTFVGACRGQPELLRHANAIWPIGNQEARSNPR
jgi:MoaA/NifB/PqqE/SkfB family radical SAM enzyme